MVRNGLTHLDLYGFQISQFANDAENIVTTELPVVFNRFITTYFSWILYFETSEQTNKYKIKFI